MLNQDINITELRWQNGELALHDFGALLAFPSSAEPPTWESTTKDTLESIVQQASTITSRRLASPNPFVNRINNNDAQENVRNWSFGKKKMRSESDNNDCRWRKSSSISFRDKEWPARRACASASAAFCGVNKKANVNDTTTMTWASIESTRSTMRTIPTDDISACDRGGSGEEPETKGETATGGSSTTRRSRAAAIHNQSERRRRQRINQKMKALQKLVPHANKTDKASMLDEVIDYLKRLQRQVQIMTTVRTMPHLLTPLGIQQQVHLSLLARMGMLDKGKFPHSSSSDASMMPQHLGPLIHPLPQISINPSAIAAPSFVVSPNVQTQQAVGQSCNVGNSTAL